MKVSIITCTLNSAVTISETLVSVNNQTYSDIEHIIVDGLSSDKTIELIKSLSTPCQVIISEKDDGLYDAINKGLKLAKGEIVGLLHSDDFYIDNDFITKIAQKFEDESIGAVYSDVRFVKGSDTGKTVRYYSSAHFSPWMFRFGHMPAHPTFFTRKRNYEKFGYYKTNYKISADYELLIRFLYTNHLKCIYMPVAGIKMRIGGISTRSLKSNFILNMEIIKACRSNGIYTNMLMLMPKYIFKSIGLIFPQNR
jgi:glycosyltransferase involved in cell wall biosynthesis